MPLGDVAWLRLEYIGRTRKINFPPSFSPLSPLRFPFPKVVQFCVKVLFSTRPHCSGGVFVVRGTFSCINKGRRNGCYSRDPFAMAGLTLGTLIYLKLWRWGKAEKKVDFEKVPVLNVLNGFVINAFLWLTISYSDNFCACNRGHFSTFMGGVRKCIFEARGSSSIENNCKNEVSREEVYIQTDGPLRIFRGFLWSPIHGSARLPCDFQQKATNFQSETFIRTGQK